MLSSIAIKYQDSEARMLHRARDTDADQVATHGGQSLPVLHVPSLDGWMQPNMAPAQIAVKLPAIHHVDAAILWEWVLKVIGQDLADHGFVMIRVAELPSIHLAAPSSPEHLAKLLRRRSLEHMASGPGT